MRRVPGSIVPPPVDEPQPLLPASRVRSGSARVPAILVTALLVAVIGWGVSGRLAEQAAAPAATVPSPVRAAVASPTPMPAMVGSPSALPRPSTPEPTPMPTVPTQEASFWIVAMARGERVGRVPLVPVPGGWEGAMRVDRSWRDRGVVVELVGRQPDGPEHVLSSVGVPRFSGRLLELPLELAKGELVIEEPVASPPPGSDGRFDIVRQLLTLRHSLELQEGRGTIMRLRAVVSVDAAMQVTFLGDPAPPSP